MFLLAVTWPESVGSLTDLMSYISNALSVLWGYFATFLQQITSNPILLFCVLFPICLSVIGIVMKILRRFGVR